MEYVPEAADEPRGLLDRIDAVLVGGLGLAALSLASLNVALRTFAPQHAIEWGDEVQVYLVVWAVCLSFAAITAANRHIKADLFVGMLPVALQKVLGVFADALGLFVAGVLTWYAWLVTYETWDFGDVSTTTLRFPLWIYAASLFVGMALMTLRYIIRMAHAFGIGGRRT
ncbi:TRAP transporter small permease [Roseomonas sp. HF4]|uniref:TRAP transporter small permease n=1 Tax=Roseomonas sp. HF4 TaxID=2562313 RepID=UPI0010C0A35D|nr:TRAP transporter small permease [Roseomonas sp. HF4]